jgi:DNA-binding transcriptional regulator YiaG
MQDPQLTARQFKARLKQAGISQRKFALWLGFDVGTVNRWARGNRPVPQYAAVLVTLLAKLPELAALAKQQRLP